MNRYFVDQAVAADEREARLPAWVRDKLATMRRATNEALAEIDGIKSGSAPGPFWIEAWDNSARYYLPHNSGRLMFGDPKAAAAIMLTAGVSGRPDGWLNLNGQSGDGIVAAPWATNVLLVKIGERVTGE